MCCGSKTDNIGRKVTLTASIWYRLYSWELPSLKPKEIVEKIGGNKMNETELKDLSDKILSGELVLDEELEKLLEGFAEFCKKIAEYLENTFIPAIKDFFNILWDTPNVYNGKRSQQVIKYKMLENQKPRPLYLDKRRKVHICRSNC